MSLDGIKPGLGMYKAIESIREVRDVKGAEQAPKTSSQAPDSFGELFSKAIGEVNSMQVEAEQQLEGLVMKKDGVTPHGAMIALEKADVAFQLMTSIRSKIVQAYQEVMRTQV